jgi:dihydroxyacetone kinase-like protein
VWHPFADQETLVTLTLKLARDWIERSASVLAASQQVLTELDAAIGDADHGINMDRGFRKILTTLAAAAPDDIGSLFKLAGMALIGSVGGAAGPLYGTLFLRMAAEADGKAELAEKDVAVVFRRGLQGLMDRGQAGPGAKTMIDAWLPAVEALETACEDGCGLAEAVHRMAQAARGGMLATVPLQATKGRASYLGERSIGHQDPGATSSYLILQALDDVVGGC